MSLCTTATLYAGFKSAISTASTAIGFGVLRSAGYSGYSAIGKAAGASVLGGAALGMLDFMVQGSLNHLVGPQDLSPSMRKLYSELSFATSHFASGLVGFKLLSLLSDSISAELSTSAMLASTGVGSGILAGGTIVLMGAFLLCCRPAATPAEVAMNESELLEQDQGYDLMQEEQGGLRHSMVSP